MLLIVELAQQNITIVVFNEYKKLFSYVGIQSIYNELLCI